MGTGDAAEEFVDLDAAVRAIGDADVALAQAQRFLKEPGFPQELTTPETRLVAAVRDLLDAFADLLLRASTAGEAATGEEPEVSTSETIIVEAAGDTDDDHEVPGGAGGGGG